MASKFCFNLKKAAIYRALKREKQPAFRFAKIFKKLFLILSIGFFLLFLFGFVPEKFSPKTSAVFLTLVIFFLILAIFYWLLETFFNSKLKNPPFPKNLKRQIKPLDEAIVNNEKYNLAEFLDFETAKAVWQSIEFAKSKKYPEINSTILFYFLLASNPELDFIFSRAVLKQKEILELLKNYLKTLTSKKNKFSENYTKDFQNSIFEALKIAQKRGRRKIELGDMVTALAEFDPIFKKILIDQKLKIQDIENLTEWLESLKKKNRERKKFWEWKNLIKKGTLAKGWAAGYTVTLDKYSRDWTEIIKKEEFPEIVGHQNELIQIQRVLARQEINNVLLVGEPGVGRKSLIYTLVSKNALGESLPSLNYKRVVELDLPALLSELESREEVEATLNEIFQEVISAGNIILVIDEFHNFVSGKLRPGVIDISGILSSFLRSPQFQIIAVTSYQGLHRNIEQRPSISAFFEKVEVAEISQKETIIILENLALELEKKHKIFVSYPAIRNIVYFADRYFLDIPFPRKAINILDEVIVYVSGQTKDKLVLPEHVAKIVSEKTGVPVGEIEIKEREILLNLESLIHQRIINQDEAVKGVSAALRRARAEVQIRKGPMGSFLFLGPTGVGKTETAKALAAIYFGSESKIIRLDMSEFQAIRDIPRLIGSPGEEGLLTTPVRENPFSLILLDEIEKAHSNILNLFLQVLDEGHLTDGQGRKVDFRNSIIVATSNAGYKIILEALKQKTEWSGVKQKLIGELFEKAIFRPEFINRFDAMVVFRPLSKGNLLDIAELMLQDLEKNLKEKGIEFIITKPLKEKIVELSYSPVFGARQMRRVIQNKIENALAKALLNKELKRGDKVEIVPPAFKLKIN